MRPYADTLTELLQNLSGSIEDASGSVYATERPVQKVLLVAITSNRGLCGGFNSNIIKEVANQRDNNYAGKQVDVFTIGKKGNDILSKDFSVAENRGDVFDELTFANVATVADQLMALYASGAYDRIDLVYNRFKNAATQLVTTEQFLPIVPVSGVTTSSSDYIYEPAQEEIVSTLIPKALKTQLFKALRDSFASEHGARMTAMHKATDNATELRDQLKLTYNKARQAAITNEILEIVGGAEALNG
jgi:F-type H+-transporting ATPase subunit gamma